MLLGSRAAGRSLFRCRRLAGHFLDSVGDSGHSSSRGAGKLCRGLDYTLAATLGGWLVGGLKTFAIKSNLGNTDGGEGLAMSHQFLVLLLALVVEDQDL